MLSTHIQARNPYHPYSSKNERELCLTIGIAGITTAFALQQFATASINHRLLAVAIPLAIAITSGSYLRRENTLINQFYNALDPVIPFENLPQTIEDICLTMGLVGIVASISLSVFGAISSDATILIAGGSIITILAGAKSN